MSNIFPADWTVKPLEKIALQEKGSIVDGPFGSNLKTSDYVASGIPVLQGKNITNDKFKWFDVRYITETKAEELRRSSVRVGDILIVKIGSVGYSAIVDDLQGYEYAIIPANLLKISVNEKAFSTSFLHQYLTSPEGRKRLIDAASTTAQPALSLATVKQFSIPIPPLPEQQKIATILSSVDDVIEKTRVQIDKLKDLKTGMMQELLTKGIGHTEFKDSPVGRIPASWDVQLLHDVCERVCVGFVGTCERHYRASGVPMIRTGNLKDGKLDLTGVRHVTDEFHKKEKKSQLKAGDLLIARHGSHGSACLVPENLGEANCLNVVIVRPSQTLAMPLFLKYVFNSGAMKASFGAKSEGSTQSVISTTEIAKTAFPIPSIAEQRQISAALSTIDGRIESVERKLTNSLALKKALMQDLLTGKVRVKLNESVAL